MSKEAMKLDKEDITTAKEMAKVLRRSGKDELIVVGMLLDALLKEREKALAKQEQSTECVGEPAKLWCETCEGTGEVYQEHQANCHVGGHFKCPDCDGEGYIVSSLYSTTPQPKQKQGEPVGEMQLSAIYESMVVPVVPVELPAGTKLYTTQQPRTWVGLTDEEIDAEADKEEQAHGFIQGVSWAEAKLREKNSL